MKNIKITFLSAAIGLVVASLVPGYSVAQTNPNAGIEAQVQSYFADIPVMIAIANCESGFRQFNASGGILYGGNGYMVGVYQLDETVHSAKASSLGWDIDTVSGNLAYARYLYGEEGTEPWISSFGCWSASSTAAASAVFQASSTATSGIVIVTNPPSISSTTPLLTENLSLGDIDPEVLILQQSLNQLGFTLAASGPGSAGSETTKFGALTRAALENFQCAKGIACSGDEATTGYGYFNASTRAALLAALGASDTSSTSTPSSIIVDATVASSTASSTVNEQDNSAEITQLQSQIVALVALIAQLEQAIAAKAS